MSSMLDDEMVDDVSRASFEVIDNRGVGYNPRDLHRQAARTVLEVFAGKLALQIAERRRKVAEKASSTRGNDRAPWCGEMDALDYVLDRLGVER